MREEDFAQFLCFMVTYLRGIESARTDRVCHDPFAELLTRDIAPQIAPHVTKWLQKQPHVGGYIAMVYQYLDEALRQRDPSIHQIVLLGSGLDSRARHCEPLRGCHVLEIDRSAELFHHKKAVFEKLDPPLVSARNDYIVADLTDFNWEEKLLSSGFDSKLPTFWAMENLLIYLERRTAVALLKTVDVLSAPGSEIWADVVGKAAENESELSFLKEVNTLSQTEVGKNLLKFGDDDALKGLLDELPWQLRLQASLIGGETHFGREWVSILSGGSQLPVPFSFVLGKKPGL